MFSNYTSILPFSSPHCCLAESAGLLAAVLADRLLAALLGGAALLAAPLSGVLAGCRRGSGCAFNSTPINDGRH